MLLPAILPSDSGYDCRIVTTRFKWSVVSSSRIINLLDSQEDRFSRMARISLETIRGEVKFENVSFAGMVREGRRLKHQSRYSGRKNICTGFGAAGAGKSSVVNLLSRLAKSTRVIS